MQRFGRILLCSAIAFAAALANALAGNVLCRSDTHIAVEAPHHRGGCPAVSKSAECPAADHTHVREGHHRDGESVVIRAAAGCTDLAFDTSDANPSSRRTTLLDAQPASDFALLTLAHALAIHDNRSPSGPAWSPPEPVRHVILLN
jgi:hypothetical protein